MTALEEAKTAATKLSPAERFSFVEWLTHETVELAPGIFSTPGVCGGDACVRGMRIPVWLLEEGRRNGTTGAQFLQAHPDLTMEDLAHAWRYVAEHPEEIERAIRENDEV